MNLSDTIKVLPTVFHSPPLLQTRHLAPGENVCVYFFFKGNKTKIPLSFLIIFAGTMRHFDRIRRLATLLQSFQMTLS